MSVIPEALQGLSSSPLTTLQASLAAVTPTLSKLNSLTAPTDFAIGHLNSMNKTAALHSLFPKPAAGNVVSAGLGRGTPVGGLSVPRTWTTAAPARQRLRGAWGGEPIHLVSEPPGTQAADKYGG
jgi:PPE-repeat protein